MVEPIVFIVDDDEAVRDSLKTLLESYERMVRGFASPADLLGSGKYREPDCLVLDHDTPGMSGLDLLADLRRRGVSPPTILMTGLCNANIRQRAAAAGVLAVLEKPFSSCTLLDLVARALGHPSLDNPAS